MSKIEIQLTNYNIWCEQNGLRPTNYCNFEKFLQTQKQKREVEESVLEKKQSEIYELKQALAKATAVAELYRSKYEETVVVLQQIKQSLGGF